MSNFNPIEQFVCVLNYGRKTMAKSSHRKYLKGYSVLCILEIEAGEFVEGGIGRYTIISSEQDSLAVLNV